MSQHLLCGAAKNSITPDENLLPYLFGLMDIKYSRVHDELYVRVIYLENGDGKALLVSYDLDKAPYPDEWVVELSEITGVAQENILYAAIHTHSAPITGYRPFEPKSDVTKKDLEVQKAVKKYEAFVKECLLETAKAALASKRSAKIGYGMEDCFININRVVQYTSKNEDGLVLQECGQGANGNRPVDHAVYVLKIVDLEGKPIGFFINYAVHCVVMFRNDTGNGTSVISGDIGGNVSQRIEAETPGSIAIWSSGVAGDVNPVMMTQILYADPKTGEMKESLIKYFNNSSILLDAMVGHHLTVIRKVICKINCDQEDPKIAASVEWSLTPTRGEESGPYKIRMHLIIIGEMAIMGINGELYSSHGFKIKEASPLKNTVIVNHDSSLLQENPGYILDDETIYFCEVAGKISIPGRNFRGRPRTIAESLMNHTRSMFAGLLSG
jgi:hypothetical protein